MTSLRGGPLADVANVKMGDWPRIGANVGEVTVSLPEVHNGERCAAQVTIFGVRGVNQRPVHTSGNQMKVCKLSRARKKHSNQ